MSTELEIQITVDTNDGDLETEISTISEETLEKIKPLIEKIKNFQSYTGLVDTAVHTARFKQEYTHDHNYPCGEMLRDDLGEKEPRKLYSDIDEEVFQLFEEFLPQSEFGFHTIESIKVMPKQENTKLL